MRKNKSLGLRFCAVLVVVAVIFLAIGLQAQETTGALQGTVKDPAGAVVPNAIVELSGAVVGARTLRSDASGYYRFANLPPGAYMITVRMPGFETLKREGITIEVGHLPTLDLALKVGSQSTVVEVSAEAPLIDLTTTSTVTNITNAVIQQVPHGYSFQSVIQFAPAARNEPLAGSMLNPAPITGSAGGNGNGGNSPGNGGNGNSFGYSVAGGSDSENSYLVEGQETASLIGGYSHTNVPFQFIQEVQMKSSGVEAQYGGSLGGVVNVVMKHGSNDWHGSLGGSYESGGMDGGAANYLRYDPQDSGSGRFDPTAQPYQPLKDQLRDIQPYVTAGGALVKDRVWFFTGFAPEYIARGRTVNFGSNDGNAGLQTFNRDQQTYYGNGRLDIKVSNKLNVFTSWLYQFQRQSGEERPYADSNNGLFNPTATAPLTNYEHGYGFAAPNTTLNIGADLTITPSLVATTRFGYFFENYHDFGFPTGGAVFLWQASGSAASQCLPTDSSTCSGAPFAGDPTAAPLEQATGFQSGALNQNYTLKDADKHFQFDQDLAWFKSSKWGSHNFKGGYQLNRISNDMFQKWSAPAVQVYPGQIYSSGSATGAGPYGYFLVNDAGTDGQATSYNHAFFAQDAWTIGKGVTVNVGIRFEHENLPAEAFGVQEGLPANPIQFGWGSKIAPRIGAAWDIFRDGKMKLFGSYGVFNDEMKLNLAISSFGGQYWQNCAYALNDPNYTDIVISPNAGGRYCTGSNSNPALYSQTAGTPNTFIENVNFRANATETVAPNFKPYRQHESVFGVDYQLKRNLAFEARWDRRRLDHVIEDAGVFVDGSEVYTIVNPGEGINSTNGACGSACPANVRPNRNYDGLEFRLNKAVSNHWSGMVAYTYSKFRGNYSGLTSTDLADGGGGRNSPNNSRAFDETYFMYNAYGTSSNGLLATDRPNTFKGYAYYQMNEGKSATTNIGIFQTMYQGTPLSSYIDVGYWLQPDFAPVYPESRGKWADISQDPLTGALTVNSVGVRRTPWYNQSDLNLAQEFKPNRNSDRQVLGFEATISNLFNQHSPVSYGTQIDSANSFSFLSPGGYEATGSGASYAAFEHPYDWKAMLNTNTTTSLVSPTNPTGANPIILNSQYGKVLASQLSRTIRLSVHYTF